MQSTRDEVSGALASAGAASAGRPLLTYYDDATGDRTALSDTDLGAWANRTANLLTGDCRLGAGDHAALLLPPHWQTAAVLLGAWSAGLSVSFRLAATAGLPPIGPGTREPVDVAFAATARIRSLLEDMPEAPHRFALGCTADGAALPQAPDGWRDYASAAAGQDTRFRPADGVRLSAPASVDGTTFAEWGRIATGLAAHLGLHPGDRVLVDAAESEHPVRWLLAPLAAGASVVLCANLDRAALAERSRTEGVTRVI